MGRKCVLSVSRWMRWRSRGLSSSSSNSRVEDSTNNILIGIYKVCRIRIWEEVIIGSSLLSSNSSQRMKMMINLKEKEISINA